MMNFESKSRDPLERSSSEPGKKKRRWLLLSVPLLIGLFLLVDLVLLPSKPGSPPERPDSSAVFNLQGSSVQVIEGEVKEKGSLFKSLIGEKISLHWVDLITSKLKPLVNFKKIKGGTYRFISDVEGKLVKFVFEAGPTEIYEIEKDSQGYTAQKKKVELETHLVKVVGEVRSSLFEAMDTAGEQDTLTIDFAEILAWEIDFYKDVQEGDKIKVVVEKIYKGDQFIQYGTIHAVEYQRGERVLCGIKFKNDYYNEKGVSLQKAFIKAPLRFNRISSKFSQARKHPILGGVRPHYGVDYAAPPGTPVWAVADGTVVSSGWGGGFGNQVVLRHRNGYMTYYGHLSRFGQGIKKNRGVKQKQIIGYVGSTGLSTGPHLDYRLAKDGRYKNPLKETFPMGVPIGKGETELFEKNKNEVMSWLDGDAPFNKKLEDAEGNR